MKKVIMGDPTLFNMAIDDAEVAVQNGSEILYFRNIEQALQRYANSIARAATPMRVAIRIDDDEPIWTKTEQENGTTPPVGATIQYFDNPAVTKSGALEGWQDGDELKVIAQVVIGGTPTCVVHNKNRPLAPVSSLSSKCIKPKETEGEKTARLEREFIDAVIEYEGKDKPSISCNFIEGVRSAYRLMKQQDGK